MNSKVVRGGIYAPNYKTNNKETRVSDLFKNNSYTMQEVNKSAEVKKVYMSADKEQKLENAYMLDKLFKENRYSMSISLDNAKSKDTELNYSNKGAYFADINNNSIFINDVSKIEKLDYIPSSAVTNMSLSYSAYNIYKKSVCNTEEVAARIVFAS